MTNYAWQVTGFVIALAAVTGLGTLAVIGVYRTIASLTDRHRHRIPWRVRARFAARRLRWTFDARDRWIAWRSERTGNPVPWEDVQAELGLENEPPEDWSPAAEYGDPEDVTGLTASAPDAPQASPVTLDPRDRAWWETAGVTAATAAAADVPGPVAGHHPAHSIEVHPRDYWAGQYRANPPAPCWPAGDGDLDESAWTKRSALDLAIDLAYDDTAAGFDQLLREIRNYSDYAASGIQQRWAS